MAVRLEHNLAIGIPHGDMGIPQSRPPQRLVVMGGVKHAPAHALPLILGLHPRDDVVEAKLHIPVLAVESKTVAYALKPDIQLLTGVGERPPITVVAIAPVKVVDIDVLYLQVSIAQDG